MDAEHTDGWTLKTLKELMDERDKRYAVERESAEKAITVAERNAERWRDNANEWRSAMTDKDRNFVTKNALWGYFLGLIGLILSLITILKVF